MWIRIDLFFLQSVGHDKGLVINLYGEGGLENGKVFAPPLPSPAQDRVTFFAPPLLEGGNFVRPPPPSLWLKL